MEQDVEWGPMMRVTPYCAKSPTYGRDHVLPSPSPVEARSSCRVRQELAYRTPGVWGQDVTHRETRSILQWQTLLPAVPAGPAAPIPFARPLWSWAHVLILGELRSRFLQAVGAQMAWDRLAVTTLREI